MRTAEDICKAYELLDSETDAVTGVTNYDLPVLCAQYIDDNNNLQAIFPEKMQSDLQMKSH